MKKETLFKAINIVSRVLKEYEPKGVEERMLYEYAKNELDAVKKSRRKR